MLWFLDCRKFTVLCSPCVWCSNSKSTWAPPLRWPYHSENSADFRSANLLTFYTFSFFIIVLSLWKETIQPVILIIWGLYLLLYYESVSHSLVFLPSTSWCICCSRCFLRLKNIYILLYFLSAKDSWNQPVQFLCQTFWANLFFSLISQITNYYRLIEVLILDSLRPPQQRQ